LEDAVVQIIILSKNFMILLSTLLIENDFNQII